MLVQNSLMVAGQFLWNCLSSILLVHLVISSNNCSSNSKNFWRILLGHVHGHGHGWWTSTSCFVFTLLVIKRCKVKTIFFWVKIKLHKYFNSPSLSSNLPNRFNESLTSHPVPLYKVFRFSVIFQISFQA